MQAPGCDGRDRQDSELGFLLLRPGGGSFAAAGVARRLTLPFRHLSPHTDQLAGPAVARSHAADVCHRRPWRRVLAPRRSLQLVLAGGTRNVARRQRCAVRRWSWPLGPSPSPCPAAVPRRRSGVRVLWGRLRGAKCGERPLSESVRSLSAQSHRSTTRPAEFELRFRGREHGSCWGIKAEQVPRCPGFACRCTEIPEATCSAVL